MNGHCETCKYWEMPNGNGEGRFGTCLLITAMSGKFAPNDRAYIEDSNHEAHYNPMRLKTTASFGCTEYESMGETNGKGPS